MFGGGTIGTRLSPTLEWKASHVTALPSTSRSSPIPDSAIKTSLYGGTLLKSGMGFRQVSRPCEQREVIRQGSVGLGIRNELSLEGPKPGTSGRK